MALSRVLRPFLSALPKQPSRSFFPEKANPPFWLENLGKKGHEKKLKDIYPRMITPEPYKQLPGEEPQTYPPSIYKYTYAMRKRQKQSERKDEMRIEKAKINVVTENEVNIIVVANNIIGSWKRLHPISKQIQKKPLDHAILQCYFKSTWNPRYRDTMTALLQARRIAQEGGVKDTSDLWVYNATVARHRTDINSMTVMGKSKMGRNARFWSNLAVHVVKGKPVRKRKNMTESEKDFYLKFTDPLPIHEDNTCK